MNSPIGEMWFSEPKTCCPLKYTCEICPHTVFPFNKPLSIREIAVLSKITKLHCLPLAISPTLLSIPRILAGFVHRA